MTKKTKRPATPEEVEEAKKSHAHYLAVNNYDNPEQMVEDKLAEALAEGYKNETCECGVTYLAFHHFCTCRDPECPFSDGKSLLDHMKESLEEDGNAVKGEET
jgi:hypothetical protein